MLISLMSTDGFSFKLPEKIPPSWKGNAIKYTYSIFVSGTTKREKKAQQQQVGFVQSFFMGPSNDVQNIGIVNIPFTVISPNTCKPFII